MQNFLNILFKHQISATSSAILLKHQISNASSVITRSLFIAQHLHPHRRTDHTQLFSERLFVRVIFLINVHNDLVISAWWGPIRKWPTFLEVSLKCCCIFQMVSTWVTPSFGQMLMVHCCTNHSIIWNSDLYPLHYLTGRLPVTRLCGGGKNTSMYMKVPYTSPLDDTYCASFLYAAIIKDWYFLAHLVHRHWYDERLSAPSHGSPDLKESIAP